MCKKQKRDGRPSYLQTVTVVLRVIGLITELLQQMH